MLGVPVSSTLQSAVKQVAISSGQILVAKGSPSVSKVMGGKQVLAQGVAKAIVSGTSGLSSQTATAKAAGGSSGKSGGQRSHAYKLVTPKSFGVPFESVMNVVFFSPFSHGYATAAC